MTLASWQAVKLVGLVVVNKLTKRSKMLTKSVGFSNERSVLLEANFGFLWR